MNVLVKYPSRARPDLFRERLLDYLADPIVSVLVTADHDDDSMNNAVMHAFLAEHEDRVTVRWGDCQSKVEACNDGLSEHPWNGIVLLASDDMLPQRADYAQRIVELFEHHFPDGCGVLHLNDGRVGQRLNTICCCDRAFFDLNGQVLYRPEYVSLWCDNEWMEVSQRLGCAVYVPEVLIRHAWVGQHAPDALHRRNESFNSIDARTFQQRKRAGFPR